MDNFLWHLSVYNTDGYYAKKNPDCGLFLKLALPCFCVFILIRYQVWFHSPNVNGTFCPYTKLHVMQIVKFILLWRGDVVIAASKFFIWQKIAAFRNSNNHARKFRTMWVRVHKSRDHRKNSAEVEKRSVRVKNKLAIVKADNTRRSPQVFSSDGMRNICSK